jgi:hypothetical protein
MSVLAVSHRYTAEKLGCSYGTYYLPIKHYWQRYLRIPKHGWLKRTIPTELAKVIVVATMVIALR